MSFVDPATVIAGEFVDENDWNTLVGDMLYLKNNLNPPGVVLAYGGTAAPTGYLLCDGTAVSRTTYATLFSILSTTYGVGNGTTTFNLPDLRQRLPLGKAASGTGSTLGGAGGSKDAAAISHAHTVNSHSHGGGTGGHSVDHAHGTGDGGGHTHTVAGSSGFIVGFRTDSGANGIVGGSPERMTFTTIDAVGNHNHGNTGGVTANHTHSVGAESPGTNTIGSAGTDLNLPPYLTLNFIIKV